MDITGSAWWGLENGQVITEHRAETLLPVLQRLQNGERLDEAVGADTAAGSAENPTPWD